MSRSEAVIVALLALSVGAGWLWLGRLPVSRETTTRYQDDGPFSKHWHDGIGSQISVSYLPLHRLAQQAEWQGWADWASEHTLFWLRLQEKPGPNFLMVDLPYSEMHLSDDQGREYRLLNSQIARSERGRGLQESLTVFDWTLFNNAFPDGPTLDRDAMQQGPLIFEPLDPQSRQVKLHLRYCMVGKPSWRLTFDFETHR